MRQAGRLPGRLRTLRLEPLEARQLLDAGSLGAMTVEPAADDLPWQNPAFRLDINNDGLTTPSDALNLINRIRATGGGDLPPPEVTPPPFYYDANGDNRLTPADLNNVINGILAPPKVVLSSLTPYAIDVTPLVTVTAAGSTPVPDDTAVYLDVDLNSDGDFNDPGELGHTQSTLFAGSSTFPITPALERSDTLYAVNLRARLKNVEAVPGNSKVMPLGIDTLTSTALQDYVNTPDDSYTYSLEEVSNNGTYTYYVLNMTSQTWRSSEDVNLPVWRHWVAVYVPNTPTIQDTAVLLIDGGSNTNERSEVGPISEFGNLAFATSSVIVDLRTVPNEPVIFTDETQSRSEDAIIAYTFDKFIENLGEPGNKTWPLLLPMVKSAVRAMDTVQDFVPSQRIGSHIDDFVVTGYSKRGWTTWLTAAIDDRVKAIIPGVFDNLNQGPQMVHHYGVYGFFSSAVKPYEDLQIFSRLLTVESQQLSPITDPYRYLTNGRFDDMPKLLINSAGDQFFVSDSAQYYFDDIPGDENYLLYIPNVAHGLDINEGEINPAVVNATLSFYDAVLNDRPLPHFSWTVSQSGMIEVQAETAPADVKLWQITNPDARDFRRNAIPDIDWTSTTLVNLGANRFVGDVPVPVEGATAYFVQLTFDNPTPFMPDFIFTTEIRVKTTLPFQPWPFEVDMFDVDALPSAVAANQVAQAAAAAAPDTTSGSARDAVAVALAVDSGNGAVTLQSAVDSMLPTGEDDPASAALAVNGLMLSESPLADQNVSNDSDRADEVTDCLFGSSLDELLDLV